MTAGASAGPGTGAEKSARLAPPLEVVFPDPRAREVALSAMRGEAAQIRAIVALSASDPEGPLDINEAPPSGITLLMYAIASGDERATRALLDAGADPNALTPLGDSPMLVAALAQDPRFLHLLLDRGGDPNLRSQRGEPLLLRVLDSLALANAHVLLDRGADINVTDSAGETPLFRLATVNQFEEVNALLDRGADPSRADVTGRTLRDLTERSRVAPGSKADGWRKRVMERI